jgi:hypothetical protein
VKTVRFSQVVETAGKPEVYLLFAENDPEFEKALKQDRIMTLVERGSSPPFGLVGREAGQHGQLLLFPRPLKKFAGARIVGIKFDLFSEPSPTKKKAPERPQRAGPKPAPKPQAGPARKTPPVRGDRPAAHKVIAFAREPASPEVARVEKLKEEARRALQALEQGETRAASRHLLRLLKG